MLRSVKHAKNLLGAVRPLAAHSMLGHNYEHNRQTPTTPITQKRNYQITPDDVAFVASLTATAAPIIGASAFIYNRYRVSKPDEYLVRTGLFIEDMEIGKQGFQWPFQKYKYITMHPVNYTFELQAMSIEKMEFVLPGVFTIGPKDEIGALKKYMRLLPLPDDKDSPEQKNRMDVLVKGVLEGETRILAAQMTIEEIFNDRKAFKEILIKNVQNEMDQFGLQIYNANIKEMTDSAGSEYFSFLRQKKRSEAENRAKVDVSEAKKVGDIGQKERQATTRQQVAAFEAETVLLENKRRQEIELSNAELAVVHAAASQKTQLANIEAEKMAQIREAELQKEVEQRRISMETEKLRASDMSHAQVHAEINMKDAEGKAKALEIEATAKLFAKQKEADGILAVYNAQSAGIEKLISSFGGNTESLIRYIMLDKGLYEKLAQTNAAAIQGLNPKITIWSGADGNGSGSGSYAKTIADVLKMVPPLVTTIHDQTGIKPPKWMVDMDADVDGDRDSSVPKKN